MTVPAIVVQATTQAAPTPPAPADSRAEAAARLAEQQAKSIQELLDARAGSSDAIPVIEPAKRPPPPAAAAVANVPPPATAKAAPPADEFRPVPPLGSANVLPDVAPSAPVPSAVPPVASSSVPVASPEVARVASPADTGLNRQLAGAARESPRDLAAQLDEQLWKFAKGEAVPSAESIAGLSEEDRDLLTGLLDGLSNFRNAIRQDPNLLMNKKILPVIAMADRLRAKADLHVRNFSLCRAVAGYGNYTPFAPLRLAQGVNHKPKIYYEVENVAARLDANNMWSTVMRQDLTLFDANGKAVWNLPAVPVTDVCRNRRRDFFFARAIDLPTSLPPGQYVLKVTLADLVAQRVSEASLNLTIVPQNAAPALPPAGPPLVQ
ncbi:MAG TPA: hypothetical protein VF595_14180 [Tepidisphaeraceae bacterium]